MVTLRRHGWGIADLADVAMPPLPQPRYVVTGAASGGGGGEGDDGEDKSLCLPQTPLLGTGYRSAQTMRSQQVGDRRYESNHKHPCGAAGCGCGGVTGPMGSA